MVCVRRGSNPHALACGPSIDVAYRAVAAGWSKWITDENKGKWLPFPLVDSPEGDLRKAARQWAEEEGAPMPSPPRVVTGFESDTGSDSDDEAKAFVGDESRRSASPTLGGRCRQ